MCVAGQPVVVGHGCVVSGAAGTQVHHWPAREHLVVDIGGEPRLEVNNNNKTTMFTTDITQ